MFRAGFGIYTNQAAYSILQNLAENVPFFLLKTVTNTPGDAVVHDREYSDVQSHRRHWRE